VVRNVGSTPLRVSQSPRVAHTPTHEEEEPVLLYPQGVNQTIGGLRGVNVGP